MVSLCTSLLSFLFPALILYLPNNIPRTIEELQLWRLLSSFLVNGSGLSAVLRILFVYYLMYITLPDLVTVPPFRRGSFPLPGPSSRSSSRFCSAIWSWWPWGIRC